MEGEGGQSAANRSLGSCLLLIFWERRRLVVLFRRTGALVLKLEVLLERRVLGRSSAGERLPAAPPHPPHARRPAHVCSVAAARRLTPVIFAGVELMIHPDCVSSIRAGHSHRSFRPG